MGMEIWEGMGEGCGRGRVIEGCGRSRRRALSSLLRDGKGRSGQKNGSGG